MQREDVGQVCSPRLSVDRAAVHISVLPPRVARRCRANRVHVDHGKAREQHLRRLKDTQGSAVQKQDRVSEFLTLELDSVVAFSKSNSAEVHVRVHSLLHSLLSPTLTTTLTLTLDPWQLRDNSHQEACWKERRAEK